MHHSFYRTHTKANSGFTLIELLVCIALISVLSFLGFSSFWTYRSTAALSVSHQTLRNARTALEAGINGDVQPPAVDATQTTQGAITDADMREYLPGMQVPKNVSLYASYDPTCNDGTCESDRLEVRHCLGKEYITWFRAGDGVGPNLPIISTGPFACP